MLPPNMSQDEYERETDRLVELGWAFRAPHPRGEGTVVVPWMPPEVEKRVAAELEAVFEHVDQGPWLMLSYLDLAVCDSPFIEHTSPKWIGDYFSHERYILHRWYTKLQIAFVFQPETYRPKTLFRTRETLRRQWPIMRDYVAAGICAQNRVLLFKIQPNELSYDGIVRKIKGFAPVKPLKKNGPIDITMKKLTRLYIRSLNERTDERPMLNGTL